MQHKQSGPSEQQNIKHRRNLGLFRSDTARFSHLLWHKARKWIRSVFQSQSQYGPWPQSLHMAHIIVQKIWYVPSSLPYAT